MKTTLLILLTTWFTLTAVHGQTNVYHPFPDSNAVWNGTFNGGLMGCWESYSYTINGDTLIGSFVYHKLYIPYVQTNGICGLIHIAGYNGCFRQDIPDRKIYYIAPDDSTEDLLFNFNLQVGDTIYGFNRLGCTQLTDTITLIDSTLIGTDYRKRWYFGASPEINAMIEGIGFYSGLLEGCAGGMLDAPSYMLNCFKQNGITIYPDTTTNCQIVTSVNSIDKLLSVVKIYPNPLSILTTLRLDKYLSDASLTVYNSFGQKVKQIKNITGQTVTLHRDNLPSGLYFIRLTQDNKIITADKLVIADK
ncbi:MAG: T9SS type A sorting domain-containing protein [Bacteroidetes bacterium]|nr:T9SS type A sorting domain-containing protein [Bacteroidota bacterium]